MGYFVRIKYNFFSLDAISAQYCGSYAQILVGYFVGIKYKCGSYAQIFVGYFVGIKCGGSYAHILVGYFVGKKCGGSYAQIFGG